MGDELPNQGLVGADSNQPPSIDGGTFLLKGLEVKTMNDTTKKQRKF